MSEVVRMDYDAWEKEFKPMINYIDPDSAFNQTMFEIYGDEVEHVCDRSNTPDTERTVWTYIDGDEGTYIVDGYHIVNRIGYFITEKSADADTAYEILVDKYDDNDDEWDTTVGDGMSEIEVLETPYFAGCTHIWARIDGEDSRLSYEQVRGSRAVYTSEEVFDGEQTLILSDGRRAQVQSIDLQYNAKEPIGANITYRWKGNDPIRQGLIGGYVSFGDYDEERNEGNFDEGCDSFGVHDTRIFHYFPDGVTEMMAYMMEDKGEFSIVEYVYAYA